MPIIHEVGQGEAEWLQLRIGKVTASELSSLVTPEFKIRDGATPHTYLCEKVAEAWRGKALPGFSTWETEQGQLLEDEARGWYCLTHTDHKLRNVGFVEGDDGRCGASPDALLGDDGGLELKCPQPTNHVRYLLAGVVPKDYITQVHMSLCVTGRKWWRFVSYHRGYPALVVNVPRDEVICAKIQAALSAFYSSFDAAMAKLQQIDKTT